MTQFARPTSDVTVSGWQTDSGTTTNLFQRIDETVPDDSDYVTFNVVPATYIAGLGSVTDPSVSSGHVITVRVSMNPGVVIVSLLQSSTVIATFTPTGSGSFTTSTYTLTSGEADSITNYGALRLRFVPDAAESGLVSQAYFEVPDVSGTSPALVMIV